ncbi:hypothetical protein TL16_g10834 [Triparma laevis f. inornata]|uniref:Uncharacterized protein n=1 Tax=Triparma laevis f. inornata TaxID=1714386 RepID=A0A9W7ERJ8_9STRA|nr:hypothetical protein TL16_g10834 [Triparma laevis f. inornata]
MRGRRAAQSTIGDNALDDVLDVEDFTTNLIELQKLAKMFTLVSSEIGVDTLKSLATAHPHSYSNLRMLRFLRKSKSRNINSAATRFVNCVKWRDEWSVDGLLSPDDMRLPSKTFQEIQGMFNVVVENTEGETTTIVLSADQWDTQGLMRALNDEETLSLDDFLLYWVSKYETIHKMLYARSLESGKLEYANLRCTLKDLRLSQFSRSFVNEVRHEERSDDVTT